MASIIDYSLYLVTDRDLLAGKDLLTTVEAAIQGGVTVVQLREKNCSSRDFYQLAQQLQALTRRYQIPLIINDRLDIALAIDADGLHIGQSDLPLAVARRLLGPAKIIGVSASDLITAKQEAAMGADYLGVGAIFPTDTKSDADQVSLATLTAIKQAVKIPVVAIGGIHAGNLASLNSTGIDGVAVVSAIIAQADPEAAAVRLRQLLRKS
jgi:thiamine-phosphate pyrophosphorylase